MATPMMRARQSAPAAGAEGPAYNRRRAALRLLNAERSEEIFPVLLEEIVALGFPRALVAEVDFETAELRTVAALNCPKTLQDRFRLSLWADNAAVQVLHRMQPETISLQKGNGRKLYCHPMLFSTRQPCWEAERDHRVDCLAVLNYSRSRKLNLHEQVCNACDMRAYASLVAVELPARGLAREKLELGPLIELANRYLARLFKVEHYYNRMRDMDLTIAQMSTVMQSMPDPVILTDAQHRVILQ